MSQDPRPKPLGLNMPMPSIERKAPFLEVEQEGRFTWKARVAVEERWHYTNASQPPTHGEWEIEHYGPCRPNAAGAGMYRPGGWPYWFKGFGRARALRKAQKWLDRDRKERQMIADRERVEGYGER